MPDLTEEEYAALDELWTNNPPAVSGDGNRGFFMQHRGEIVLLDDLSATYLHARAEISHRTLSEVISEDELQEIVSFCAAVGLPITLEGLNIKNPQPDDLMEVARIACAAGDALGNMPFAVQPAGVVDAILGADAIGGAFQAQIPAFPGLHI